MKTLVPMITLMVIVLLAGTVIGSDTVPSKRFAYQDAIDEEIAQSRQMASLLTSRSAKLRMKGHREASKAMFLESHRDKLVQEMMKMDLEPKTYKVERFLNDRFNCSCYATWAAR